MFIRLSVQTIFDSEKQKQKTQIFRDFEFKNSKITKNENSSEGMSEC